MHRALLTLLLLIVLANVATASAQTNCRTPPLDVTVESSGHYELRSHIPEWTFAGDIGQAVTSIRASDGQDAVGAFHQIDFDYKGRTSGIRVYQQAPLALFTTTYTEGGANADPFPVFSSLPSLPYSLSFRDVAFSPYQLNSLADAPDGPWLFLDASGNGFLVSPASDFPVARMTVTSDGSLRSGIDTGVARLPAGCTPHTMPVLGAGPNHPFDVRGSAMTSLHG